MEELKVQMEQTHLKLKEEAKNRPEETVSQFINLYIIMLNDYRIWYWYIFI